jgi:hypothetical protein
VHACAHKTFIDFTDIESLIELTQNILEILLFLAYLCIALISILIAIYTIAISYLGRETYRSIWRKKKRRENLEKKVKELGEKADIDGIIEEIGTYEEEISEIDEKLFFLSVRGAVIVPSVFFLVALVAIFYTIYADPVGTIEFPWGQVLLIRDFPILGAIIAIVVGNFFLLKTLFAVQWAASRIPLPQFKVTFQDESTKKEYRVGEKVKTYIAVENKGEDLAEDLQIWVCFPPEFRVQGGKGYQIVLQDQPTADHLNYTAACFHIDLIHINTLGVLAPITIEMPNRPDLYEIPVQICERKIGESKHELTVEIHR